MDWNVAAHWAGIFFALSILEGIWVGYTHAVGDLKPFRAAVFAVLIYAVGTNVVVDVVSDHWLLVPACFGSFVGTFGFVWLQKRKKGQQ